MVDEQQPRVVLLFSGTRGWLRFVGVVATDSWPVNQPVSPLEIALNSHIALFLGREKEGYID